MKLKANLYQLRHYELVDLLSEEIEKNAQLEADNRQLLAALEAGCEYHHLPLIPEGSPDAWAHMVANKTIRCRLSKQARQALAKKDGE